MKTRFKFFVMILVVGLFLISCDNKEEKTQNTENIKSAADEDNIVSSEKEEMIINDYKNGLIFSDIVEKYEIPEEIAEIILTNFVNESCIEAGMYKVGSEIEPGLYFLDGECYWQITKDSTGELDSIISNDNCPSFGYVELVEGDYFSFNNGSIILRKYINFSPDHKNLQSGTYWVGNDIKEGEYKLTGNGYWERNTSARGTIESTLANDNYEGSVYVTVREDEFFKFDGAGVLVE